MDTPHGFDKLLALRDAGRADQIANLIHTATGDVFQITPAGETFLAEEIPA